MRNPLIKRLPRELKGELGKYLVIFLFIVGTISIVSGWNVAGSSMATAYDLRTATFSLQLRQMTICCLRWKPIPERSTRIFT